MILLVAGISPVLSVLPALPVSLVDPAVPLVPRAATAVLPVLGPQLAGDQLAEHRSALATTLEREREWVRNPDWFS